MRTSPLCVCRTVQEFLTKTSSCVATYTSSVVSQVSSNRWQTLAPRFKLQRTRPKTSWQHKTGCNVRLEQKSPLSSYIHPRSTLRWKLGQRQNSKVVTKPRGFEAHTDKRSLNRHFPSKMWKKSTKNPVTLKVICLRLDFRSTFC